MNKLLIAFIAIPFIVNSQNPDSNIKTFEKFNISNQSIIWQNVYQRPGMVGDSLINTINLIIQSDASLSLLGSSDNTFFYELKDRVFTSGGNLFYGRVRIDFKDDRYRVTITSITQKIGEKGMRQMDIWAGGTPEAHKLPSSIESTFLNKAKTDFNKSNLKGLKTINDWFFNAFDFKSTANDEW
ncbi:MAG: hypothetical protein KF803_10285 [Cyclobacteriaceae bacterium]|nr:hypothetical protein [Cyclobacteriaceae bacterium]